MRLCSVSAARADDHARLPLRSREGRVQPHHLQPDATTLSRTASGQAIGPVHATRATTKQE